MTPSPRQIQIAVAAATDNGRTNWTRAARALGVTRAWLVERLDVPERRGAPRSPLTRAEAVALVEKHGSLRAAGAASGWPWSTIRDRVNEPREAGVSDGGEKNRPLSEK